VATEHDLYKNIGDVDVCIEFNIFEVKVLSVFLSTVGFSRRRDGRYSYDQSISITNPFPLL
jgi:hypothetical protein